jgi:hypothetical protein
MRRLVFLMCMLASVCAVAQEVTVVQINAQWNDVHTRTDLEGLIGCKYTFGWLKDQKPDVRDNVGAVPIVIVYKDSVPVKVYRAGLSLKLDTPIEEIQAQINAIKQD